MLKINHYIVQLSNFKSLKSYVLILLVAHTALFYGHLIGANQTETGPDSDLPRWKQLESVVHKEPTALIVPEQADENYPENDLPTIKPSESIESIISETSPEFKQAYDGESENKPNLKNLQSLWKELQNKELIYVLLAVLFSVLVACLLAPAISGFRTHPKFALGLAGLLIIFLVLIAKDINLGWSFWLTMIVLAFLASGWLFYLVTNLMDRVKSILNVLFLVGFPTALFGTLIMTLVYENKPDFQLQILVFATNFICIVRGTYLAYTPEAKQLAQYLLNWLRSSKIEETSGPQSQSDDEVAAQATEEETIQSDQVNVATDNMLR